MTDRHLFFTGPIQCGKSTAVRRALGVRMELAGGFLTTPRISNGKRTGFLLRQTDGTRARCILEDTGTERQVHLDAFRELGVDLLREALHRDYVVLDEIGGVELLEPAFVEALEQVLDSGIPCIGVLKARRSAELMIGRMGKQWDFLPVYDTLWEKLEQDPHTTVYAADAFDPRMQAAAACWAETFIPCIP